jgi:hypothetical protein
MFTLTNAKFKVNENVGFGDTQSVWIAHNEFAFIFYKSLEDVQTFVNSCLHTSRGRSSFGIICDDFYFSSYPPTIENMLLSVNTVLKEGMVYRMDTYQKYGKFVIID